MIRTLALTAALGLGFAAPAAFANGNSDAALNMVETSLKGNRGTASAAATLRPGGANASLSGKGDRGWGNAGSRELSLDQVSRGRK